jgi:hypothetical protein
MRKNHLIEQLREHMVADLQSAIGEQEEEMLRAITRAAEARTDSEEPLKFSVSLRGVLNLDKDEVETAFSFSTRTAVKAKHPLEDPDQKKLPLEGVSVSLSTTGPDGEFSETATVSPFAHVHRAIEGALAKGGYEQGDDGVYRKEGGE